MTLRILMMADTPPDPNRGAAGTEVQTLNALRALGHEVDAIWTDDLGRRIEHGNLHYLLELPRAYERAAANALERKPYDILHVNQPHGFRAARMVHRKWPRTAFIHRSHGFELHVDATLAQWNSVYGVEERSTLRRIASSLLLPMLRNHGRAIAREADGHIVSSSLDAGFLTDFLGVPPEKIAVIAQAAPDSYVQTDAPPMNPQRLRRVLHVAQFVFQKAPMIVAQAVNRIIAAEPALQFTWVCDRADEPAIRALLTPQANAQTEVLHWTTQDALRGIYDRHGVFLFPSFFEGFGKAFLEAMSRGSCVVASDVGAMHDLIDGHNGVLVAPGDAAGLAEAALSIIRDPSRAATMSTLAASKAREYTWDRMARETAAFYQWRLDARAAVGK